MKIDRIWIQQLGQTKQLELCFHSGWNHVVGNNEGGKTTLFIFIQAMLFGFKGPFDYQFKENDGGLMEFELHQQTYILERYYGKNRGRATITTADKSETFDDKWLNEQLGMTLKEGRAIYFMNPFYLMEQSRLSIQEFQKLAFSILQSGTDRLLVLEKQYDKQLRLLYKKRGMGTIQMDMNAYLQKEQQMQHAMKEENQVQFEMERQQQQQVLQALLDEQQELNEQLKAHKFPDLMQDTFIKYLLYRPQALRIREQLNQPTSVPLKEVPSSDPMLTKLRVIAEVGLLILILLSSFSSWRFLLWGVLILTFVGVHRFFQEEKPAFSSEKKEAEWESAYSKWEQFFYCSDKLSLKKKLDELEEKWQKINSVSPTDMDKIAGTIVKNIAASLGNSAIQTLKENKSYRVAIWYAGQRYTQFSQNENTQIKQKLQQVQHSIQQQQEQWAEQWVDYRKNEQPIALLRQQHSVMHEKLLQDLAQYQQLQLKKSWLKDVQESYQKNQLPSLLEQASYYFARLTGYRYKKIRFEQDQFVVEGEDQQIKTIQSLSTATKQQLLLSQRFAFIMSQEDQLPIVLDEIWVFFDEERENNLFHLLEQLATSKQIISFATRPLPRAIAHHEIRLEEDYD